MRVSTLRVLSRSKLGRRGTVLLALAFVDLMYGWSMIRPSPEQLLGSAYRWRESIMPTEAWGMIWIVVGIVLAINAFMQQDRVGYAVAVALKISWALVSIASFLSGEVRQGWVSAAIWLVVALMTTVISGWPEPVRAEPVTVIIDEPGDA